MPCFNITTLSLICLALAANVYSVPLKDTKLTISKRSLNTEAVEEEERMVQQGHTIELECSAFGSSPPVIHWLKDGEFIPQGPLDNMARNVIAPPNPGAASLKLDDGYKYDTVSTLLLRDTQPSDSARYSCVADLPEERKTKHFAVVVMQSEDNHGQPSKRSESEEEETSEDEETRIYMYTDKAFGLEGPSSLYICRATQGLTRAPPVIQWSINGEVITDDLPGFKLHSNGDLMVTHTTFSFHMAEIMCTAIGNNGSRDEKSPFIYLFEPED